MIFILYVLGTVGGLGEQCDIHERIDACMMRCRPVFT